jgi:hypothetical protein
LRGEGFVEGRGPTTTLPPGYPVFLSLAFFFWDNPPVVGLLTNFGLSFLSIWLTYAALRPRSQRYANVAAFALAAHPFLAMYVGQMSSETFGVFLVSLLVFHLSRYERAGSLVNTFAIGFLCMAIALTSPVVVFLSAAVWLVVAFRSRQRPGQVTFLALGALVLFVPWQRHCYRAVGHLEPLLYGRATTISTTGKSAITRNSEREDAVNLNSGITRWIRSWLVRPTHEAIWWAPSTFDVIPADVFDSGEQRQLLGDLYRRSFLQPQTIDVNAYDKAFAAAADRRIEQRPLHFYAGLPLLRGALLWIDSPYDFAYIDWIDQVPRLTVATFRENQASVGTGRAVLRLGRAFCRAAVAGLYLAYPLGFVWLAFRTCRDRRFIPAALVLGALAYTWVSGYYAMVDCRRNLVFFPALLFLTYYLPLASHGDA